MDHKAGDTVRIRSKEWIDAQGKDEDGNIHFPGEKSVFNLDMQKHAGERVAIQEVQDRGVYYLEELNNAWEDWMLDPAYRPEDEPLSVKDAIRAMLDGETLYDEDGRRVIFNAEEDWFEYEGAEGDGLIGEVFKGLSRRLPKRKRPMTRWEILAWANSDESRGWLAKHKHSDEWCTPQYSSYTDFAGYKRVRLLPDNSGIDENTIQGFEVEE
jgi:hypothetical protein